MIDQYGLIVDQTGDGADACNFNCCAIALGIYDPMKAAQAVGWFWNNGRPVRHPFQIPANNPNSFSRDQAVLLMQVLSPERIEQFLNSCGWFFPNTERDWPGSTKYPRPHVYYEDSHPSRETLVKTFNLWRLRFEGTLPPAKWYDKNGIEHDAVIVEKNFDHADFMTPDFTAMSLILAGRDPSLGHLTLAKFLCRQAIKDHCRKAWADKTYSDFKQLYFTAKVLGVHRELAVEHPWGLPFAANMYFTKRRNLPELEQGFLKEFEREGFLD